MKADSGRQQGDKWLLRDRRGFTITELLVVMGIFLILMMITSNSFNRIAIQSSQQSKSLETQIEGIVGLEVLRADLEQAGFGLPWSIPAGVTYAEANLGSSKPDTDYWVSGSANDFNDAVVSGTGNPPRAVVSGNTKFNIYDGKGATYLVIKSSNIATNDTVKKWTSVALDAWGAKTRTEWGDSNRDFDSSERVIVVRNNMTATPPSRDLMATGGNFSARFSKYSTLVSGISNSTFELYGIASATSPGSEQVRMPFNRADYYVMTPPASSMPSGCAPHTGVLYKSVISQDSTSSGGGYSTTIPLLDCVADLQIVYGLDTDGTGRVNLHTDTLSPTMTAAQIREQFREIRAYILAQDGQKDLLYTYPSNTVDVGESFDGGATIMGRRFDLGNIIGSGWQNYRWKVYTIVVRPKNLIQ